MLSGLADVDWSSMHHACGPADDVPGLLTAISSADPEQRRTALATFASFAHHQGDVYRCTTASLPFLFELAERADPADRAAIVDLMVSIGTEADECCGGHDEHGNEIDHAGALRVLRVRGETFVDFASDTDVRVRRAAIPALGRFLIDSELAAAELRRRLDAETGIAERLLAVETMATLALRRPSLWAPTRPWLIDLADDSAAGAETRLAAIAQLARCSPELIDDDTAPAAIALMTEIVDAPFTAAVDPELAWPDHVRAPTTGPLWTLHDSLAERITDRTALLTVQLRSRDPAARIDALILSRLLMKTWRGDHTGLIELVADQLDPNHDRVAAEAAEVLSACHAIAEPARERLAAYVMAHGTAHRPESLTTRDEWLRRPEYKALWALARLGDLRATPGLIAALDSGVGAWPATQLAGALPAAAAELVPRLCDRLRLADVGDPGPETRALLSSLVQLGDVAAVPLIVDTLVRAVDANAASAIEAALDALATFGALAQVGLQTIRSLVTAQVSVRASAIAALWAVGRDPLEALPLLLGNMAADVPFRFRKVSGALGEIGPEASIALPRLRGLMTHSSEWVRAYAAAAVWDIGGEPEASEVLTVLLQCWAENPSTSTHVVAALDRMGPAVAPALPWLHERLGRPRRNDPTDGIGRDEQLLRTGRAIIARLA